MEIDGIKMHNKNANVNYDHGNEYYDEHSKLL